MPGTFSDSWKLTKTSFRLIREDRSLLVFPVVAGLSGLGVVALLILGLYWIVLPFEIAQGGSTPPVILLGLALFLVAYFAMTFVSVYCTAALIGAATLKLSGQQPTAADGWRIARAKAGRLLVWALITGTVGLAIRAVANRVGGVGGLIVGAVGGASWAVVTYFMIPVLLYEGDTLGVWATIKRSGGLFVDNFGRSLVSNLVVGLLIGAGLVAAVVLGVLGLVYLVGGAAVLGLALLGLGIAVAIGVALIGSAAEGILRAALYRYATTGKVDPDLLPASFALPSSRPAP
jgi:hypothetical protein